MFILPKIKGWQEELGENLGRGLSEGISQATNLISDRYQQKKTSEYFNDLAQRNPNNPQYRLMADAMASPLPSDQKNALVKALIGSSDPYRAQQQERLNKDSISSQYGRAITEIDNAIKNGVYRPFTPEHKRAIEVRHALVQERDKLLGLLKAEENDLESEYGTDFSSPEMDMDEGEQDLNKPKKMFKKEKFDPSNPKHRKKYEFLKRKHGNNKELINRILSREFE